MPATRWPGTFLIAALPALALGLAACDQQSADTGATSGSSATAERPAADTAGTSGTAGTPGTRPGDMMPPGAAPQGTPVTPTGTAPGQHTGGSGTPPPSGQQ